MDSASSTQVSSTLFGDTSSVMSAVASLLSRQQSQVAKEDGLGLSAPMLVLTNAPRKDAMQASVVLSSSNGTSFSQPFLGSEDNFSNRESLVSSFEQVHALATANLLASTQRDIAQQLAEATTIHPTPIQVSGSKMKKDTRKSQKNGKDKKDLPCQDDSDKKNEENNQSCNKTAIPLQPKALECSYKGCSRKFAWLTHLKYHELTHTNNRQFECPDENCGKTFFTAQRLKVHLRTHTGERPFKCFHNDCGKTFTTAGNLKNHERIHTGEQPFVCDYADCKRRFTEYSSLRKHKLTHSGDKPFKCKICDKKFTQSGSRRQHLIRHHLDDEIRNSLKGKSSSVEEEESDTPRNSENDVERLKTLGKNSELVSSLARGPQVMLLKNTYQGLGEHMVTVTTQTGNTHHLVDSGTFSLSQTLLNSDGLHDDHLGGKSDELVVLSETPIFRQEELSETPIFRQEELSETPIYRQEEHPADIVYAAGILDHEEVAQADYVSTQVEFSEEINSGAYSQSEQINSDVNFSQQDVVTHSTDFDGHGGYIHSENLQGVSGFEGAKDLSNTFLSSEGDVMSGDFIGAEEVTVSNYHHIMPFLRLKKS